MIARPEESVPPGECVRGALTALTATLREAGIDVPERDARALMCLALGVGAVALIAEPDRRLSPDEWARLDEFTRRRLDREPVSRLRGEREFYGRPFLISSDTLDPRPETETLIEAALQLIGESGWQDRPLRILDVGTGSGAILATLLAELPHATGLGTDISPGALAMAARNAELLGVAARASFRVARSLDGIPPAFDLLVSNPPYIPAADIAALDAEVARYDPVAALDGGPDGLNVYRQLAAGMVRVVPAGWAVLEVGAGQAIDVASIFRGPDQPSQPTRNVRYWQDLGGHTRCVAISTLV